MRLNKTILSFLIAAPLALGGCSGAKEKLGLEKTVPDEFKVVKRAPLSMPPDFNLLPPQPGVRRPQEKAPDEQARQTVFGLKTKIDPKPASDIETALLQEAGADMARPDIRQIVDAEKDEIDNSNKPVADRVLGVVGMSYSDKNAEGNVIDPIAEAERLKISKDAAEAPVNISEGMEEKAKADAAKNK